MNKDVGSLIISSSLVKYSVPYSNSVVFSSDLHIQSRLGISQAHMCICILHVFTCKNIPHAALDL